MVMLGLQLVLLTLTLVLYSTSFVYASLDEYRIVETLNGKLRGKLNTTLFDAKPFYSFRGIPYAQPPVGEFRFKPPLPVNSWTGVKDTFHHGERCAQICSFTKRFVGHEDCLFLNVYVPVHNASQRLPVMFYIHGGGFSSGSTVGYGPDFLISNDVILVTINFRLNVFGFMSLGMPEYSGNMGLKDQWLALKWVNDNIEYFGGDITKITIFGQSSGSVSIDCHLLSAKSRGLFQRAILQSGVLLMPAVHFEKTNHLAILNSFAKDQGKIRNGNFDEVIRFLKTVDAELILTVFQNEQKPSLPERRRFYELIWTPVIEESNDIDPFLTECPDDIWKRSLVSDADTLIGLTFSEGILFRFGDIFNPSRMETFNEYFEIQFPKWKIELDYNSQEYKEITKEIREFFFPNNAAIGKDTLNEYASIVSDVSLNVVIIESAKQQSKYSSGRTYLYRFSLELDIHYRKNVLGIEDRIIPGATHGDDLLFLFRIDDSLTGVPFKDAQKDLPLSSLEMKSIRLMSKLWTQFAKYGTPTLPPDSVHFMPIENDVMNFADITNDGLVPGVNLLHRNMQFWDNLYLKYQNVFENSTKYWNVSCTKHMDTTSRALPLRCANNIEIFLIIFLLNPFNFDFFL